MAIRQLRRRIREEKNLQKRRELERRLLIVLLATRYYPRIASEFETTLRQIERLAREQADGTEFTLALNRLSSRIVTTFGEQLYDVSQEWWDQTSGSFLELAEVSVLREHYGTPIDDLGFFNPEPQDPGPAPEGASLEEILIHASPLLGIVGQGLQAPPLDQPDLEPIVSGRREGSDFWNRKLANILFGMRTGALGQALAISPRSGFLLAQNRLKDTRRAVQTEFAHEAQRVTSTTEREFNEGSEAYAGWILRSRFASNSAPDHVSRDGWRFYIDDREGATRPWSEQGEYYPPYRKNCICFPVPIYESTSTDGSERLGIEELPDIKPRDVGTWDTWFSAQRPGIQRQIIGDQRWFAAASFGGGSIRWIDVMDDRGRLMSARKIATEPGGSRRQRIEAAQELLRERRARHDEAWLDGKYRLTPAEEAEERRRLASYLRRLQA